ncbi:leishmanolysin-related zinc metalloendopeptidase [uncultured Tateyamaria sp.]|uniref:leishmanolysin-related zinc metalloendopeptidase n=1 Tax=uncultured Tateyamaria sp. TaxID=455651 RepID=UPI002634F764|nr:leishmanolysin-related zinc metalloendopeptidase [uncultured Tateyamaria sp.]
MIELTFDGDVTTERQAVFERSAARWDQVVNTGFDPIDVRGATLTGVRIDVSIRPIDGANGVLGQAGPTILRQGTELPLTGIMEFDQADVVSLETGGRFEDVILHEMAHVLGFGTLWLRQNLIAGTGTMDPRFVGTSASREFADLDPQGGNAVPISNTGGAGTRESHWRELVFGDELLTGFLSGGVRPLSRLSIASFEDIGYQVDYSSADPFELPNFRNLAMMGITEAVRICDLCRMARTEPVVLGAEAG